MQEIKKSCGGCDHFTIVFNINKNLSLLACPFGEGKEIKNNKGEILNELSGNQFRCDYFKELDNE